MNQTNTSDQKPDHGKGLMVQGFDAVKLNKVQIEPSLELSNDLLKTCNTGADFSKLLEILPGKFITNNLTKASIVKKIGSVYGVGLKYGTETAILVERGPCPIPANFEIDFLYYDSTNYMGSYFWALVDLNTKQQFNLAYAIDTHVMVNANRGDRIERLNVKTAGIWAGANRARFKISKVDILNAYQLEEHDNYSLRMHSAGSVNGYSTNATLLERLQIDFG